MLAPGGGMLVGGAALSSREQSGEGSTPVPGGAPLSAAEPPPLPGVPAGICHGSATALRHRASSVFRALTLVGIPPPLPADFPRLLSFPAVITVSSAPGWKGGVRLKCVSSNTAFILELILQLVMVSFRTSTQVGVRLPLQNQEDSRSDSRALLKRERKGVLS